MFPTNPILFRIWRLNLRSGELFIKTLIILYSVTVQNNLFGFFLVVKSNNFKPSDSLGEKMCFRKLILWVKKKFIFKSVFSLNFFSLFIKHIFYHCLIIQFFKFSNLLIFSIFLFFQFIFVLFHFSNFQIFLNTQVFNFFEFFVSPIVVIS